MIDFVVVDIETTGLAPDLNEVIEFGAVKLTYKDGQFKQIATYHQLVNPFNKIPMVVRNLTGIDNDMLKDSPRFVEIAADFISFMGDAVLVAHNVLFDQKMINSNLKRAGFPMLNNRALDSQDLVAIAYPEIHSHRLGDIVHELGIEAGNMHRALDDALATAEVMIRAIDKIKKLPPAIVLQMFKLMQKINHPLKDILEELRQAIMQQLEVADLESLNNWKKHLKSQQRFQKSPYSKEEEDVTAVEVTQIEDYFSEVGKAAEVFEDFEFRTQQLDMAKRILQAFNNDEHLMIEAGTGTGKSAAYLLPMMLWIIQNGGPLIVSTRTKNLQDQLMDKDIPTIQKLLPGKVIQTMLLKGRQNYLCMRKFEHLVQEMILRNSKDIIKILPFFTWITETVDGDISYLHNSISKRFAAQVNSESLTCSGESCPSFRRCYLQNVRRRAKSADLLVVNHSLVFTDMVGDGFILPKYKYIVFDEAHTVEDAATEAFSLKINIASLMDSIKGLESSATIPELNNYTEDLRNDLKELFDVLGKAAEQITIVGYEREKIVPISAVAENGDLWSGVELLLLAIVKLSKKIKSIWQNYLEDIDGEEEEKNAQVSSSGYQLDQELAILRDVLQGKDNYCNWISLVRIRNFTSVNLQAAPINIGEILQNDLLALKKSIVMTSATLSVGGSFEYFCQRYGVYGDIKNKFDFAEIGSPYDYSKKMLCLVPDDLGPINDSKEQLLKVAEHVAAVTQVMDGKTMVLFTSNKMMDGCYRILKELLDEFGISVLCQGIHGSRRAILHRFKQYRKAVLLGTSSFWEGVDIKGDALSCVVIVKLPFAVPNDPVIKARADYIDESGGRSFMEYSVPQAVIRFKQGVGRLIRSGTDRGVIVVLDERIYTKTYGKAFLKSLPPCEVKRLSQENLLEYMINWNAV